MLTRLQVDGFKNLLKIDIRFGPFTCIAGCNGVGKSNLFDAISFLGALARVPLLEAALLIRGERGRSGDIRRIFHHYGAQFDPEMEFIADLIIPQSAIDDLGQHAKASYTFLRYTLKLQYRTEEIHDRSVNPIRITKEELTYLPKKEIPENLLFKFSSRWRDSIISGKKTTKLISTESREGKTIIKLHQDGKRGGKTQSLLASSLPRTVLSSTNAAESPTALCARREMESWMLLQLEPSALRKPDDFTAPAILTNNGEHLPATLHRLASTDPERIYQQVSNDLSELISDVKEIRVDADEKRQIYTLFVKDRAGTGHPAHALSDGTLRFLALSIIGRDPQVQGLICLEEPENGIHPERIPAMLELLRNMAVDPKEPVDETNPLRQVIVNTHSPGFVGEVPDDALVAVEKKEIKYQGNLINGIVLSAMKGTWRLSGTQNLIQTITKNVLLSYLQPFLPKNDNASSAVKQKNDDVEKRVFDRYVEQMDFLKEHKVAEPNADYGKN
ncbi:MAG: AAA family ATPase [Chitinispirillaceae bacterium]|nr:AAA family ATPase [Chitinispirillaceae bacterium]